jgi:hypothetical protein
MPAFGLHAENILGVELLRGMELLPCQLLTFMPALSTSSLPGTSRPGITSVPAFEFHAGFSAILVDTSIFKWGIWLHPADGMLPGVMHL